MHPRVARACARLTAEESQAKLTEQDRLAAELPLLRALWLQEDATLDDDERNMLAARKVNWNPALDPPHDPDLDGEEE